MARPAAYALLLLLATLWGSSYLFIRVAVEEIPPLTLIAARVAIAAAFLLAVMAARRERLPRGRAVWGRLYVQAVLNSIGAWTVLAWGQQHIGAGLASVLNSTAPLFVFFISLAGACLGVAGVALIVGAEALEGLGRSDALALTGQGAALLGALMYAGAAIYGRRFGDIGPVAAAAGTMIWATTTLVPAALIVDRPWRLSPSAEALAAAGALGLFCTGVALILYFRLIEALGSMGVASQAYLRAGIGVALGAVVLGEEVAPTAALGLAATILGVALINRPARG